MLTCGPGKVHPTIWQVKSLQEALRLSIPTNCQTLRLISLATNASFNRFPFNGFTYYLTLFSKFFSSFPHGTCSLSVSCQYLALDEIYHPFWAAFSNNPTRRERIVKRRTPSRRRDSHPLWYPVPKDLYQGRLRKRFYKLQLAVQIHGDFKFELFPLHSPLLRES